MTALDRVPANDYLHVSVYEDGDPSRLLAHYIEEHKWGDPPDRTMLVVNEQGDPWAARVAATDWATMPFRRQTVEDMYAFQRKQDYERAKPLTEICDAAGRVIYAGRHGIQFSLSLAEWLTENVANRRAYIYTAHIYREDLYTDEYRRIMNEEMARVKAMRRTRGEGNPEPGQR